MIICLVSELKPALKCVVRRLESELTVFASMYAVGVLCGFAAVSFLYRLAFLCKYLFSPAATIKLLK